MPACVGLLELKGSELGLLKSTLKILYAGCLCLSLDISAQFTPKICVAVRNQEKFMKTPNLGVQLQSRARSSKR